MYYIVLGKRSKNTKLAAMRLRRIKYKKEQSLTTEIYIYTYVYISIYINKCIKTVEKHMLSIFVYSPLKIFENMYT